jgi:hypothetical protein
MTTRREVFRLMGTALAPALGAALAKGKGKSHAKNNGSSGFAPPDVTIIVDYVGGNPGLVTAEAQRLPPGLAKKLQKGKPLPPGWQKKVVVFPAPLERRLPPLAPGYRRVIVDRWALVIADATNVVLDVIDLVRN